MIKESQYKRKPRVGRIPLANGIDLLVKEGNMETKELLVAIGALTTLYAEAYKENKQEKEKVKNMLCEFIDKIYEDKLPEGIFVKKPMK